MSTAANCPFYGHHMFLPKSDAGIPFMLIGDLGSNRCALHITHHSPCWMEVNHMPVDWKECPFVKQLRVGLSETPDRET